MSSFIVPALGFHRGNVSVDDPNPRDCLSARFVLGTSQSRSTSAGSATPPQSNASECSPLSEAISKSGAGNSAHAIKSRAEVEWSGQFVDDHIRRPISLEHAVSGRCLRTVPECERSSDEGIAGPPGLELRVPAPSPLPLDQAPPGLEHLMPHEPAKVPLPPGLDLLAKEHFAVTDLAASSVPVSVETAAEHRVTMAAMVPPPPVERAPELSEILTPPPPTASLPPPPPAEAAPLLAATPPPAAPIFNADVLNLSQVVPQPTAMPPSLQLALSYPALMTPGLAPAHVDNLPFFSPAIAALPPMVPPLLQAPSLVRSSTPLQPAQGLLAHSVAPPLRCGPSAPLQHGANHTQKNVQMPPTAPPAEKAPTIVQADAPPPPVGPAFGADATVLQLSEVISEPFTDLPSMGSSDHFAGACNPCAFFHSKGCGNGKQCKFCHLCPADEKKRRKAEKKEASKTTRSAGMTQRC